jgi:hypothetical protein
MGIAPTSDQIKKYREELTKCVKPSLSEGLTVGTIDFNIRTEDRGWREQVQNEQRGYRKP